MDSKNILLVATTSSMIELFNSRNIKILQKLGFNVFVAANFKKPGSISKEKQVLQWRDKCGAENVLPGITGLAQVHGRDELTGKKKAMFDGKYANNVSAWLDLKIFFKTIVDVICGRGIHEGKNEKIRMWF
jgi:hypothetical protein